MLSRNWKTLPMMTDDNDMMMLATTVMVMMKTTKMMDSLSANLLMEEMNIFIMHCQYHGCCWSKESIHR